MKITIKLSPGSYAPPEGVNHALDCQGLLDRYPRLSMFEHVATLLKKYGSVVGEISAEGGAEYERKRG